MKVSVCTGKGCKDRFSEYILDRLKSDVKFYGKENLIIEEFQCSGDCEKGPNIIVDKVIHPHMTPAKASEIIFKTNKKKKKNGNK